MSVEINAWLKHDGSYDDGLRLLKQHDVDPDIIWFLELGENSVSRRDLRAELQRIHDATLRTTLVQVDRPVAVVTQRRGPAGRGRDDGYRGVELPDQLRELRDRVKDWWGEFHALRATIKHLPTKADRARDAALIIQIGRRIRGAYHRLDTWDKTGLDPGADDAIKKSSAELLQECKNLESYLSRVRQGKRTASPEKVKQWEERVATIRAQLDADRQK